MPNVAPPVQLIAVVARLENNTHTQTDTHTHTAAPPPPLSPPPPHKTDRPSHRVPGGAKK